MNAPLYREAFDSSAQFFAAVARAGIENSVDPRLAMQAIAGMGTTSGSGGGFLVDEQTTEAIWERVHAVGRLLHRCTRQPVTRPASGIKIPTVNEASRADGSRFGGVALQWVPEGAQLPATKPDLGLMSLHARKLGGLIYVTDELLADSTALAAWIERAGAAEIAFDVEDSIVAGNGVDRPLGILNSDALITVAAEGGQAAGTVVPKNLIAMAKRFWSASHTSPGGVWLTNNDVFAQLTEATFADGSPVVQNGPNGRAILNIAIELCEYSAPLGTAGDIILADLSQYIVSERSADILSSIHIRFIQDETAFRVLTRVDGGPGWSSPIITKNSAVTQSPFVTLASRA
jgi:HK97 family phage major capsid protein